MEVAKLIFERIKQKRREQGKSLHDPIDSIGNTVTHYAAWFGKFESEKTIWLWW